MVERKKNWPRKPPTSRCDSLVAVEGRWRPRKQPTSRRDSLVVGGGRWSRNRPPTSRRDSLVVVEGRWRPRRPPTSRHDSLVAVEGRWGLFSSSWACIGLRWLLWAFVGFVVIKKQKIKCKLKNRHTYHLWRHYGLRWPALAVVGLALAFVGPCGPALAFVGRCWRSGASSVWK